MQKAQDVLFEEVVMRCAERLIIASTDEELVKRHVTHFMGVMHRAGLLEEGYVALKATFSGWGGDSLMTARIIKAARAYGEHMLDMMFS